MIVSPTLRPFGCSMYRFSPSAYVSSAMRADRFGSYSIVVTFAGMSRLSRLKSMTRYIRLWPPPRHHDVSSPRLFRPPVRFSGSTSGLCGSCVVISSNTCTVWNRRPGDVGLYLRIGIIVNPERRRTEDGRRKVLPSSVFRLPSFLGSLQELGDFFALFELHVGLLPVGPLADEAPLALHLAVRDRGPDALDLRSEQLLDRPPNVDLRRLRRDLEHQRPPVFAQKRRLFGDERATDNVCLLHARFSCSFSRASRVAIT